MTDATMDDLTRRIESCKQPLLDHLNRSCCSHCGQHVDGGWLPLRDVILAVNGIMPLDISTTTVALALADLVGAGLIEQTDEGVRTARRTP